MFGEGRNADPSLMACFLRLAKSRIIEFGEFWCYREAQLFQHLGIAFKRSGLLDENLVFLPRQGLLAFAPLVDFCDFFTVQTPFGAQPPSAQHVVEISDVVEVV